MKKFSLSLALLATFSFVGCGGGSGISTPLNSNNTKLSGNLGNGYAFYQIPWYKSLFVTPAYAAGFGKIKKAVAVPIVNGSPFLEKSKEVTIESDGTFEVSLEKSFTDPDTGNSLDANWIVLLEKNNGSYNFLSIPTSDDSDSLISLPISKTTDDIDLGDVDNSADEAKSSKDLSYLSSKVTYDINNLVALSKTDDVVKAIINQYRNNYGKDESQIINVRLTVVAGGDFDTIGTQYSKASIYKGYAINIQGASATVLKQNFNNICSNSKQIELDLPSGSTISFVGDSNNYSSLVSDGDGNLNGTSCGGSSNLFQEQNDGDWISLNFGGGTKLVNSTSVPTGDWILKFNGQELGKFDLAYSLPVENGQIKLPVPAVKLDLDTNDNNKTKGFYIKWYIGNIEVPNKVVTAIIPDATIYTQANSGLAIDCSDAMLDSNGTLKSYIAISECKENGHTPESRYYKPANSSNLKPLESVYIRYETPGNEVRFSYDQ